MPTKTKEPKDWACQECSHLMTLKQAERAQSKGCPKCHGTDVDLFVVNHADLEPRVGDEAKTVEGHPRGTPYVVEQGVYRALPGAKVGDEVTFNGEVRAVADFEPDGRLVFLKLRVKRETFVGRTYNDVATETLAAKDLERQALKVVNAECAECDVPRRLHDGKDHEFVDKVAVAAAKRAERAAAPAKVRTPRRTFTEAQIDAAKTMRAAGATYQQISDALGCPNDHGNTAWRLLKDEAKKSST
jgi:ssDNA-binding Zn-finger/Zn-ribbon topoisomerase 1